MRKTDLLHTYRDAEQLLRENRYTLTLNQKVYHRIVPSKAFYVHQWNWDSATHAIGLVHIEDRMAFDEIRSLISGQWENGLIAQITFNPHETKYFPGPEFWGTEAFATGEIITSGITQPPLLGYAVWYVYMHAADRKKAQTFLEDVLPAVEKYHDYLKTYRDAEDSGLLTIVHPWESGTDNSPRFDAALEAISLDDIPETVKEIVRTYRTDDKEGAASHRPRIHDYYRYLYLVSLYKDWHWDYRKIVSDSPFAFKDLLFSSLWARSNVGLAELFTAVGDTKRAAKYRSWHEKTLASIVDCWDEKANQFQEYNVARGTKIPVKENTIATLAPLFAGKIPSQIESALLTKLTNTAEYASVYPVPSTARNHPKFDPHRYWRGSSWPITNLFLIEGLRNTENDRAKALGETLCQNTLDMIAEKGFFEYFDPYTGEGIGFGDFSWSAAIYLCLAQTYLV